MVEWHLPPDYIVDNWTDELLVLMTDKLVERKAREAGKAEEVEAGPNNLSGKNRVSDAELFRIMGKNVKVVKKSAD